MKLLLVTAMLAAPVQMEQEMILITPAERAAIVDMLTKQNGRIEFLEKQLRDLSAKTGCA